MGAGTVLLAGLLWSAAVLPPDTIAMKDRAIQIPIQFNPARRQEIQELRLFVSTDQGRTWTQEARAKPTDQFFSFYAPQDGIYWFAVSITDIRGNREPADVNQMPPGLKVLVDTQPPILQLKTAERVGDDISVAWNIIESHPNPDSLKLEYRPADEPGAPWTPVPISPAPSGEVKIHMHAPGAYMVRMSIQDDAGNQAQAMKKVGDNGPSTSGFGPVAPPVPVNTANPGQGGGSTSTPSTPSGSGIVPVVPDIAPSAPANPPVTRVEPPAPHIDPAPAPDRTPSPASMTPIARSPRSDGPVHDASTAAGRDAQSPSSTGGPIASSNADNPARQELQNTQLINSTQISLKYNVSQFGPSGVSTAKLYITDNEGASWQYLTEDRTVNSRLSPNEAAEGRITATLPGEGTFGFRLVVESGAGLSRGAPVNGMDKPEMRVEVDLTPPEVTLYAPAPDPSKRDTLILRWTASDKNLHSAPIALEYSETENGPWKGIAAGLANTGSYSWRLPQKMPARVYLRVTARDLAGNVSEARTTKPELIDLARPEGRLIGIVSTRVQVQP
jgi:hypothetical protein